MGKEGIANASKEKNLEVAGEKCLRRKWQSALNFTGEIIPDICRIFSVTGRYRSDVHNLLTNSLTKC